MMAKETHNKAEVSLSVLKEIKVHSTYLLIFYGKAVYL